jgi:hypothetical protein
VYYSYTLISLATLIPILLQSSWDSDFQMFVIPDIREWPVSFNFDICYVNNQQGPPLPSLPPQLFLTGTPPIVGMPKYMVAY